MSRAGKQKPIDGLEDVLHLFGDGANVVLHSCCAEPIRLAAELARHAPALAGVNVYTLLPMGRAPYADVEPVRHLNIHTFFAGGVLRRAVQDGRVRNHPVALSGIPGLFARGEIKADVLMLQLPPPDAAGNFSLGLSVDYMRAVLDQDPVVIAEVNPLMPRTRGDVLVQGDQVDYVIEAKAGPVTVTPGAADETDRRIAGHIAGLIGDGVVLQAGIGAIPHLVFTHLADRSDLGIHSGIIDESIMPLIRSGAVTNVTKPHFKGRSVTTMAAGTREFYDFLDGNEAFEFHPCSLTHDWRTIAAIDGFCAINSVFQVDFAGNSNAEILGGRVMSAPGGLPDFARGASAAPDGRSIIALRATAPGGRASNIVPCLVPGIAPTVPAAHVDYVVTEYGAARLAGLDEDARRRALIGIAAPEFRGELERGTIAPERNCAADA